MTSFRAGDVVASKYRLVRIIGRGGMGLVAEAEHLHLEQAVALKFMLPEAAVVPGAVERFLREARAATRLRSPHIVTVHDVDRLPDGTPFIAMELLEGEDLGDRLRRRGRLSVDEAVGVALQVCRGLAEAHRHGIVHRDLKPANVFVATEVDGSRVVKILDFGISKLPSTTSGLTQSGAVLGSPLYMSPEQVRSTRSVDPRSDIWAVGVLLFELLTGTLPFGGESFSDVCINIITGPPASLRAARPDLDAQLERTIMRCLEKDPALRPATVDELAAALAALHGASTLDGAAAEVTAVARPGGLWKGLVAVALAVAVAAVALGWRRQEATGASRPSEPAPPPPPPPVEVLPLPLPLPPPDAGPPDAPAAPPPVSEKPRDRWDPGSRK